MSEQLDEIPEWRVSEQFLEQKRAMTEKRNVDSISQNTEMYFTEPEITESENANLISIEKVQDNVNSDVYDFTENREDTLLPENASIGFNEHVNTITSGGLPVSPEETLESISPAKEEADKADAYIAKPSDSIISKSYEEHGEEDEHELNNLLERLDLTENIRRMNESAQEDIADVIERENEIVELSEAIPAAIEEAEEVISLPKYKKPDFSLEPLDLDKESQDDTYSEISEYDVVPTIDNLEKKWKDDRAVEAESSVISITSYYDTQDKKKNEESDHENGFAYSLDDIVGLSEQKEPEESTIELVSSGTEKMTGPTIEILTSGIIDDDEEEEEEEDETLFEEVQEESVEAIDSIENVEAAESTEAMESDETSEITEPVIETLLEDDLEPDSIESIESFETTEPVKTTEDIETIETLGNIEPQKAVTKNKVSFETSPERVEVHSEEIVKKSGGARRTYYKITLD